MENKKKSANPKRQAKDVEEIIEIPEGVEASLNYELKIKGPKGELKRIFKSPIKMRLENKKIILSAKKARKREKKMLYTIMAHINNMIKGVTKGYEYKLQICFVHFPTTVTIKKENNEIIIKNFLGEAKERTSRILPEVDVKIENDIITVSSCDKESAGQTAANLETATRIRARDLRIFQDGIFIIEKPEKEK